MPEPSKSSGDGARQPFSHEDMLERIQTPRTTGTGRSGRKRKRRSHQPKKRKDRRHRVAVWGILGISLPLLAAAVLGVLWNDWRCESETFRKELSDHLSEMLGAKVHIGPLTLHGRNVIVPNVAITGTGEGGFKYAELRRLRARLDYKSFFGSALSLETLAVDECDLHFTATGGGNESLPAPRETGATSPAGTGFGLTSAPASWSVASLQVRDLNIFWDGDAPGGPLQGRPLQGLRGSRVFSGSIAEDGELLLLGGEFGFGSLSGFKLESADVKIDERMVLVEKAIVARESEETGHHKSTIEFTGSFDFGESREADLKVTVAGLEMEPLIESSWRGRVGGVFNGNLRYRKRLGDAGAGTLEGPFFVEKAWLKDLPALDALAKIMGESRFRRIEFGDGFSGVLKKRGREFTITEFNAEQPGFFKLRGEVAAGGDGALSGGLEIGVPEAMLLAIPGGKPALFGDAETGFSFAAVEPRGMLADPAENLTSRLLEVLVSGAGTGTEAAKTYQEGTAGESQSPARPESMTPPLGEKERIERLFNALLE